MSTFNITNMDGFILRSGESSILCNNGIKIIFPPKKATIKKQTTLEIIEEAVGQLERLRIV